MPISNNSKLLLTDKLLPGGKYETFTTEDTYNFKEINLDLKNFFFRVRAFIFYMIVNDDDSNVAL